MTQRAESRADSAAVTAQCNWEFIETRGFEPSCALNLHRNALAQQYYAERGFLRRHCMHVAVR